MQRDISIDILKCIAAIIITNSHMEMLYGDYSILATGGAIGDALFFFCSGYTLFLGRDADFFNWYKRRINRIYPTVFAWVLIASIMGWQEWQHRGMVDILLNGGGWFVTCIMIYYVPLWFIKRFAKQHLGIVMTIAVACIFAWYYTIGIDDVLGTNNIYGACYFKWVHYFIFMLLGSIVGLKRTKKAELVDADTPKSSIHTIKSAILLLLSIASFYALCWFKNKDGYFDYLQMLSLLPLAGVCYFFHSLCSSQAMAKLYNTKITGTSIKFIGGLCLEIYLVQYSLLTDKMNSIFPLNLIVMFVIILVAAYVLRCIARVWQQTFNKEIFCWKEIVTIY